MLHHMRRVLCMLWTLCRFYVLYVLYVLYTCMLRLLYMLCVLYTLARAHNVRDLSQEPLRHASRNQSPRRPGRRIRLETASRLRDRPRLASSLSGDGERGSELINFLCNRANCCVPGLEGPLRIM